MANDRLRPLFCDHLSLARGKYVPLKSYTNADGSYADGGSRYCQSTFGVTYDKDLLPSPGSKTFEGLPDMEGRWRGADIREGWEPATKVVMCDLFEADGTPLALCGRSALRRAVADWQALGLNPKIGLELECFAFQRGADGKLVPYDTPGSYVYSTGRLADPRRVLDAIWEQAAETGFPVECQTSEFDSPQFEFTLKFDDALKAVDDTFLFRLMAREVAAEMGVVLTFMPKPILAKGGSGLHVNFSFTDRDGRNAIGEPGQMTDLARGCIAGLMQHHRGMAALVAPTVNSYQRLKPASLSGYWQNWGIDHRGVTTRISAQGGAKARIEHRMGDAAANPYALVAATLQAARLGYAGKYPLGPAETGDCFNTKDATVGVPDDLGQALDALAADTVLTQAVGQLLCDNHVYIKRNEIEKTAALEGDALRDFYIHYV